MLRNTKMSWGLVAILFHWIIAGLFLFQFALGWYMQGQKDLLYQYGLYQRHKSFGFLILGLAALRLAWTLTSKRPEYPTTMNSSERRLAGVTHIILYLSLFALPLTGWAVVSTSPLPIATWFFGQFVIPSLPLKISMTSEQTWTSVHGFLAYSAIFLVAAHALAALRHHFHFRDNTLTRMIWPGSRRGQASQNNN